MTIAQWTAEPISLKWAGKYEPIANKLLGVISIEMGALTLCCITYILLILAPAISGAIP